MLSVIKTSSIVFYAVAAGIALLLAAVFFVTLARKKRRRRGIDVFFLILGTILLLATLVVGAFAVVNMYKPFQTAVADADGKLRILYKDKQLFAVPKLGVAIGLFTRLELSGVVVPFAVCLLCLLSVIAVGAKTYRVKKDKNAPKAQVKESVPADAVNTGSTEYLETTEQQPVGIEKAEQPALSTGAEGELPPPAQKPMEKEDAKRIVDEIDALVDGGATEEESDINTRLQRAISEGYALYDSTRDDEFGRQAIDVEEDTEDEQEPVEDELPPEQEPTEEEFVEDEPLNEEEAVEDEPAYEEELIEEEPLYEESVEEMPVYEEQVIDDEPEEEIAPIVSARRTPTEQKVITVSPESVPEQPTPAPVFEYSDVYIRTRVRTIIRRPPAQSAPVQTPQKATATPTTSSKSTAAKRKQSAPAPTPKPAARKEVVAEENSLPLTRKYIILNRRSAATVFNDYLNSKHEQEKKELTGSLNTIIMK